MPNRTIDYETNNSAHDLFRGLSRPERERLGEAVSRFARSHGLTYTDDDGKTAVITVTLRPRLVEAKKRDALWRTIRILDGAFRKTASLYVRDPSLLEIFPFTRQELQWLSILYEPQYRPGRIVSRWDANTTFSNREWKEGFSFFEVNGVGVGGLWYGPATEDLILKTVVPQLRKVDPKFRPARNHDMRRLLLGALLAQRQKLGRKNGVIALAMERASGSNYVEFERLERLYRSLGHPTLVVEPTDFHWKKEELFARGKKIDVIYRDTTLSELCHFEEKGHDLRAFREAFRHGQVVSSLEGEFDHKSVFELFTSPRYSHYFTTEERRLFQKHVLWTRLLRETKTTNARQKVVDLIPYTLKEREHLVLKPNRLYGGKGVVFGRELGSRAWAKKIEAALKEPGDWVIQEMGKLRAKRFYRPEGRKIGERDLYVVSGFFATEKGLGIVGRMSERTVVNVARRGGLTPILVLPNA